ncbi:MAG: membrane protein insertion efficiency factor YidD [Rhodoblastus sp.]|nr:MAG: membrane protein insertion efficiency factor YidD [Rhodoblastus sp.]
MRRQRPSRDRGLCLGTAIRLPSDIVGVISRCVCAAARAGDRFGAAPARFDRAAAKAAIATIRLYQRSLSRSTGVSCLFRPTCSERAIEAIERHGWNVGRGLMRAQIDRCRGEFSLLRSVSGEVILIACDGVEFASDELSPSVCGLGRRPFP